MACANCGIATERSGKVFEGNVYCKKCRHHAAPAKKCSYCPNESRFVRISHVSGLSKPACPTCITRHTPTCEACGAKRRIAGTVQGKPACRECVVRGTLRAGVCDGCSQVSDFANTKKCIGCRRLSYATYIRAELAATLSQEWLRDLFLQFGQHAGLRKSPVNAATAMKRNIPGFQKLDSVIPGPGDLTTFSVLNALLNERNAVGFPTLRNFLAATYGFDFSSSEAINHLTARRIDRTCEATSSPWIRSELEAFHRKLIAERDLRLEAGVKRCNIPIKLVSVLSCVVQARELLEHSARLGASSSLSITQSMLESYAACYPKKFHSVGRFIRQLNESKSRFSPLNLPKRRGKRSSVHLRISSDTRARIVGSWLSAKEPKELRNASVALLCLFYLQKPSKVLSMRKQNVRREGETVFVDFGRGWEEVDPEIARVLAAWLDAWHHHSRFKDIVHTEYLFPGVRPDAGYSVQSFALWLRGCHGITCNQLFATAIHGLIDAGLTDPGALVYQLGLNPDTAIRYWKDSGRDVSSFLFAETIQTMREKGELRFD